MIENTTTTASAVPTVTADFLNLGDPQALVDAHAAAIAPGQVPLAEEIARFVAYVGQEIRATTARIDHDLRRTHESSHEELWAENDAAVDKLRILEAVPTLKVAIGTLPESEVAEIWDQYGPYDDDGDDE
ncbi:hypothetical protein MKK84_03435 [Methylobacterium sp. E-065]|uniref:hypothetical protein n=1 Tax=Methylobacterium sp. E-065 TaxID=2836583 RepID=UPI001FBB48E0|nr:hypothetical protein [Methylobacterium sp. E-065]MCJ2016484.1 hypothetical protein [Methylobacterium sp. E-065]